MDTQTIKATKEEIFPITHGTLQEINEMSQLHTNPSIIVVSHLSSWGGRRQKGGENDGKARGVEDKL